MRIPANVVKHRLSDRVPGRPTVRVTVHEFSRAQLRRVSAEISLIIEADDGVYALTHLWWKADRTPAVDPLGADQAAIERGRDRILAAADIVIPGHGESFRTGR